MAKNLKSIRNEECHSTRNVSITPLCFTLKKSTQNYDSNPFKLLSYKKVSKIQLYNLLSSSGNVLASAKYIELENDTPEVDLTNGWIDVANESIRDIQVN